MVWGLFGPNKSTHKYLQAVKGKEIIKYNTGSSSREDNYYYHHHCAWSKWLVIIFLFTTEKQAVLILMEEVEKNWREIVYSFW